MEFPTIRQPISSAENTRQVQQPGKVFPLAPPTPGTTRGAPTQPEAPEEAAAPRDAVERSGEDRRQFQRRRDRWPVLLDTRTGADRRRQSRRDQDEEVTGSIDVRA